MSADDFTVTLADARAFGYCVAGVRSYMRNAGLDLRTFIREGYPASVMTATGPQGARLVDWMRERRLG